MTQHDNGRRIGPGSLATCKRCGCQGLAWTQNKAGRWYLCGTFRSQSENELYVMATWSPHRCEDHVARMAEIRAEQERADRERAEREAESEHAAAVIRRGLPKLRAKLQAETDPTARAGLETLLADLESEFLA